MQTKREEAYILPKCVDAITEEDYRETEMLVNATRAFARCTHQYIYIIDYFKQNFLYISEKLAFWCEKAYREAKENGYNAFLNLIPENELKDLIKINRKGYEFFDRLPLHERVDYTFSYDFHLRQGNKLRLANFNITPLTIARDGHVWLALCTVSPSAWDTPGHAFIQKAGSNLYYEYTSDKNTWMLKKCMPLNETERSILTLSAQGYTVNDIATTLYKSVDAIKANKRCLFTQMGVRNITEALSYATNYKLI